MLKMMRQNKTVWWLGNLLLLCIYGVAFAHTLTAQHHNENDEYNCYLCLLLNGAVLPALIFFLLLIKSPDNTTRIVAGQCFLGTDSFSQVIPRAPPSTSL